MKARNKVTGEVVSNFGWSKEYGTISYIGADGFLHYFSGNGMDWEILDESETDLDAFRREAAKDILCALITGRMADKVTCKDRALMAISQADALIEELQTR